jgi:hypothetical protein
VELHKVTAKSDWRVIEAREAAIRSRLHGKLQLVAATYGLATLALGLWAGMPPAFLLLAALLFAAAFVAFPLWTVIHRQPRARETLATAAIVVGASTLLSALTLPDELRPANMAHLIRLPTALAMLVPVAVWTLLFWAGSRHSNLLHGLGLRGGRVFRQCAVGAALGSALGFHFWVVISAAPGLDRLDNVTPAALLWITCVGIGLRSLGEEITLRGLLYRLLPGNTGQWLNERRLRILVLNLPLYLAPIICCSNALNLLLGLGYGLLFATMAILLRRALGSAIAPLAANVTFNLFFALVMMP